MKVKSLSHVQLFATLWTAAYRAPPSMGFSRQEYWSGVPLPSPGMSPYHPGNSLCLSSTLETLSLDSQYILSFIFSFISVDHHPSPCRSILRKNESVSCSVMSETLSPHGLQPTSLLCPWDSPDKMLEWVALPFPRGSSQPRDRSWVSCIAGILYHCLSNQGSPRKDNRWI